MQRQANPLSKSETTILKGVAILSMVFMHLFNNLARMEKFSVCDVIIMDEPLSYHISKLCLCVPMYLFLSGYGLYLSWQNHPQLRPLRRCLLLYLRFWVVCAVFIGLGALLKPDVYPGSWMNLLANVSAWHTTYNGEWWFLFPYLMLVFLAPLLMPLVRKMNSLLLFLISGFLYLAVYCSIKFNQDYLITHYIVYHPLLVLSCSFSFLTGAICAKTQLFALVSRIVNEVHHTWFKQTVLLLIIVLLFVLQTMLPVSIFGSIFAFIFMFAFVNLRRYRTLDTFLTVMGKQSTNMWLIHTFFCYYLFAPFIYSFTYPPLIFLVTIVLSYAAGLVIDLLYGPLRRLAVGKLT